MSGYLLRMVASVQNPGGSIHPMLGSLLSPSPFRTGGEEIPGPDAERTSARQISVLAPRTDVAVAPGFLSAAGSEHPSGKEHAEPARVERSSFKPLMSATLPGEAERRAVAPTSVVSEAVESRRPALLAQPDATYWSAATSAPANPGQSQNEDEVSEAIPPSEPSVRGTERKNVRDVVYRPRYQPLMAELAPRTEERSSIPFTAGVRKTGKRGVSGREVTPERQPDEIQIHIGRIEVVAVPPAPVRAETKPANKSLDLGDYLKLRHGRS